MLSKHYDSTEVYRRAWLYVYSVIFVHQQWHSPRRWKTKKKLDGYAIVKSDWINNMEHIGTSDIKSSSAILGQTTYGERLNIMPIYCLSWSQDGSPDIFRKSMPNPFKLHIITTRESHHFNSILVSFYVIFCACLKTMLVG